MPLAQSHRVIHEQRGNKASLASEERAGVRCSSHHLGDHGLVLKATVARGGRLRSAIHFAQDSARERKASKRVFQLLLLLIIFDRKAPVRFHKL